MERVSGKRVSQSPRKLLYQYGPTNLGAADAQEARQKDRTVSILVTGNGRTLNS